MTDTGRMAVLDIHIEHCHLCAEFESCEEFWRLLGLATKGDDE